MVVCFTSKHPLIHYYNHAYPFGYSPNRFYQKGFSDRSASYLYTRRRCCCQDYYNVWLKIYSYWAWEWILPIWQISIDGWTGNVAHWLVDIIARGIHGKDQSAYAAWGLCYQLMYTLIHLLCCFLLKALNMYCNYELYVLGASLEWVLKSRNANFWRIYSPILGHSKPSIWPPMYMHMFTFGYPLSVSPLPPCQHKSNQ